VYELRLFETNVSRPQGFDGMQRKETMTTLRLTGLTLRVKDLEKQLEFYRDLLGFYVLRTEGKETELALEQKNFALTLVHEPLAPLRPKSTLGLYHFALLLPDNHSQRW
jgi:catechol-2,3-dioxygenase